MAKYVCKRCGAEFDATPEDFGQNAWPVHCGRQMVVKPSDEIAKLVEEIEARENVNACIEYSIIDDDDECVELSISYDKNAKNYKYIDNNAINAEICNEFECVYSKNHEITFSSSSNDADSDFVYYTFKYDKN
jgi:DNA-directed RNA polymerase subunit RPC12/RpoP